MNSTRVHERMIWLLDHIFAMPSRCNGTTAWHEETIDAFLKEFPEADKSLKVYTLGPNSCPMLDATARRAAKMGYLRAGSIGNQDAKHYGLRTWSRYLSLTGKPWR
jgi:hypothetical protein